MTGGMVLVLGPLGRNFGAGMTNGVAYVLDEDGIFPSRLNTEMVTLAAFEERDDSVVQQLIHEHLERTGSPRAKRLLEEWEKYRPRFRKVVPNGAASAVSSATSRESRAESREPRVESQELKLGTGN
jgi:glutamate synthase domain-containing protein 3